MIAAGTMNEEPLRTPATKKLTAVVTVDLQRGQARRETTE